MASLNIAVGAAQLPLTADAVGDARIVPDIARDTLLALFKQALISELSAGWESVVLNTPLYGRPVVADAYPEEPTESLLKQRASSYPALYLHPIDERATESWTFSQDRVRQQWRLYYLIGQLDAGMGHKFSALLTRWVPQVIEATVSARAHPDYAGGAWVIGPGTVSGIEALSVRSQRAPRIGDPESASLHGVALSLESVELVTPGATNDPFEDGAVVQMDLGADGVEVVENYVDVDTNNPEPE